MVLYQDIPDYFRTPYLQMPLVAQTWALYVFSSLAIATLVWGIVRARIERSLAPVYYVLGGALTCFLEPILARLGHATHAQAGQITAFEGLGLLVPWHAAVSYTFYFGAAYLLLVPAFRDRRYSPKQIWAILGSITVSAWVFEAPLVHIGLWSYFGDQPYQPFHLQPIWWSAGSAVMLLVPIMLIARLGDRLQGWRQALIIPLAPMGAMAGASACCWPVWVALSSPAGEVVRYAAATLTILFAVLIVWISEPFITRHPVHDAAFRAIIPPVTAQSLTAVLDR